MHPAPNVPDPTPEEVLQFAVTLIIEGRIPVEFLKEDDISMVREQKKKTYAEGPHCPLVSGWPHTKPHQCTHLSHLCLRHSNISKALQNIPNGKVVIEVYLSPKTVAEMSTSVAAQPHSGDIILERWLLELVDNKSFTKDTVTMSWLFCALRSKLHFSQLSSWLVKYKEGCFPSDVNYRVCQYEGSDYWAPLGVNDELPAVAIGRNSVFMISVDSIERREEFPFPTRVFGAEAGTRSDFAGKWWSQVNPLKVPFSVDEVVDKTKFLPQPCGSRDFEKLPNEIGVHYMQQPHMPNVEALVLMKKESLKPDLDFLLRPPGKSDMVDDRMKIPCEKSGKHDCKCALDEDADNPQEPTGPRRRSSMSRARFDLPKPDDSVRILHGKFKDVYQEENQSSVQSENVWNPFLAAILRSGEKKEEDKGSERTSDCKLECVSQVEELEPEKQEERKESEEDDEEHADARPLVPSAREQLRFHRLLESASQLIFRRREGLPLIHSSSPHRVNPISLKFGEEEYDRESSRVPVSPGAASACAEFTKSRPLLPMPMLGSFEECLLNGRLEPVSTVEGFTAELAANGKWMPSHLHLPVTVFFYSLSDNEKVSSPYLGHINLVKKGYNVPSRGTIQVTLFNPLKTVVKMFVVPYDLDDMPVNTCTFLRQRTLYLPTGWPKDLPPKFVNKYSRYLIHLRFCRSKSGNIYLHTDIRMVIFRRTDADTAIEMFHPRDMSYEMRSQTYGPTNPKYSFKLGGEK